MSDTWKHAGVIAITSIEQARKARLAALAHQADELRQQSEASSEQLRLVMEEMNRLSQNYAAEYVEKVKRERRYAR